MKVVILDTNGFLRWLLNDITAQADQVHTLFLQAKKGQIELVIPQIVIFEIIFALEKFYEKEKEEVIDIVRTLLATDYVQVEQRTIFLTALKKYQKQSISLVDCFLAAQAEESKADLFTFDKKLQKLIAK